MVREQIVGYERNQFGMMRHLLEKCVRLYDDELLQDGNMQMLDRLIWTYKRGAPDAGSCGLVRRMVSEPIQD